ncbi:MAG: phospholipase C type enzyme [Ramalina farinacea]|uniref:Phospholipase C type enzyme n=1 Tax=Ramalina farinacea TaxID=258253 RepID=A0AA43QNU4_9LECA|nr:phospholipase C type enzyme [Ramalina farinacea]
MTTSAEEVKPMGAETEQFIPSTINILTYNVFGLKFIAGYRRERLSEIGRRLAAHSPVPEIVALQECWTQEDYQSIHHQTKHILPFAKFYYSGIFGGGLAILSKWPIIESSMFRYPLNGRPTAFWRGDWYVGKGVACAKIRYGSAVQDVVEVFCTHLHAPYESEPHDSYICHRTAQAWEIAKLMTGAAERGHLVLGLGDFNMLPLSFAHRLIEGHAPVRDAWRILHPDSSIGTSTHPEEKKRKRVVPTAAFNITENGAASDNVLNTFRWPKSRQKRLFKGESITVDDSTPDPNAKRLDYIFVGEERHLRVAKSTRWEVRSVNVAMTERHPTLGCSLSDHFAVEATISRSSSNGTFVRGDETSQNSPEIPFYDSVLAMISTYIVRERWQRKSRLAHFLLSVFVSIACLVAVWWSPRNFASFILMLVSTLNLSAGVIDGLIGGLFVGSELRALKEFQWEIFNAKGLAEAGNLNDP